MSEPDQLSLHGARCAIGPRVSLLASIHVSGGHIARIARSLASSDATLGNLEIDLGGYFLLPGLINAHDHLEFALFPRLANPPYPNYVVWGEDIHRTHPSIIAQHRSIPKDLRVWWGGIRNLLCGVTTVAHHNPFQAEMERLDFPVRVVREYGWGHSLALGGDLHAARSSTPEGAPFIIHACEGTDQLAKEEIWELDHLGLLDANSIIVHGLALDKAGVELIRQRRTSLVLCPSSNRFLFNKVPDWSIIRGVENLALGSDSPLTSEGDLLDEVRFAMRNLGLSAHSVYRMVTEAPASMLRLRDSQGSIKVSGAADLIAVWDSGHNAAETIRSLTFKDVELVMVAGRVNLASEAIFAKLPGQMQIGMEPLSVAGITRWLRAPVVQLLEQTEAFVGAGMVKIGSRSIHIPRFTEPGQTRSLHERGVPFSDSPGTHLCRRHADA